MSSTCNFVPYSSVRSALSRFSSFFQRLALQSTGPNGKQYLIKLNPQSDSVEITKSSFIFLSSFTSSDPLLRILVESVVSARNNIYDHGWFMLYFASVLISSGIVCEFPLRFVLNSLSQAVIECTAVMEKIKRKMDWRSCADALYLCRSALVALNVDSCQSDFLASQVLKAYIQSLPHLPNVCAVNLPLFETSVKQNCVVVPIYFASFSTAEKELFAVSSLYKCVVFSNLYFDDTNSVDSSNLQREDKKQLLSKLALSLHNLNVKIVFCQKRVDPFLHLMLKCYEIFVVERLSLRFVHLVSPLCGSLINSFFVLPHDVGNAEIKLIAIGDIDYFEIVSKSSTICLATSDSNVKPSDISSILSLLSISKHLLFGGGRCELELANYLRLRVLLFYSMF